MRSIQNIKIKIQQIKTYIFYSSKSFTFRSAHAQNWLKEFHKAILFLSN